MDVFTYGTLQVDAIWRRVARQECAAVAGVAHGYRASRVAGADYPAMVESAGDSVAGLVYRGASAETLRRLDAFEGARYVRRPIAVQCANGPMQCQAYLLAPSCVDQLTDEPWSLGEFVNGDAIKRFTSRYFGFPAIEDQHVEG